MLNSVISRIPRRGTLIVAVTLLAFVNCEQVEVTTVSAARVELLPQNASVTVSESARLTATVLSSEGKTLTGRTIDWASLHQDIATVDGTGMVRGLAVGAATIRATSGDASGTATVTVTAAPSISLSPSNITFSAVQNGATPGDRTVAVTNSGTGALSGLTATVRYGAGEPAEWLTASLASTNAPAVVVLVANQRNFTPGTYNATVDIASSLPGVATRQLTVRLTVLTSAPAIGLGANTISFAAAQGGADPAEQQVGLTNAGGGSLTELAATIEYQGQRTGWLTATLSGTTAPAQLILRAATANTPAGSYTANVRVTSAVAQNNPQTVTVNFAVAAPQAALALSQQTMIYDATRGGGNPLSQTVQVTGLNSAQIAELTHTVTYGAGQPTGWASASLSATTTPANLTVNVATGSLPTGIYSATLALASTNATNSPQAIEIMFNVADPQIPPPQNPPANLSAKVASATQVDLSWTAPSSGTVTTYRIERQDPGNSFQEIAQVAAGGTTYSSTGLTGGTQYNYRVRACNQVSCTGYSNTATALTSPNAPANLTGTVVSPAQIDLTWSASVGAADYTIERQTSGGSFGQIATVTGTTYSDTGVSSTTQYSYRVKACNASGCSPFSAPVSPTTTPTTPSGPSAPTNLQATAVSSGQIDLTWTAPATGTVTNYRVERTVSGSAFAEIAGNVTGTSYSNTTGLVAGTQYTYQVRACNANGCSPYSSQASAQTVPDVPSQLNAQALNSNQIDLTWSAPTGLVSTYEIERRSGNNGAFVQIFSVPASALGYLDNTVLPDSQYGYRVRACTGASCSGYSNIANAKTPKLGKPSPPNSLTATAVSPSQINLSWSPGSGSVSWQIIERSSPGSHFAQIDSIAASATSYANTALTDSTRYDYRVIACNSAGCSGHSNTATATTPLAVPGIPQNLLAASAGQRTNQIDLSWTAAAGRVARYELEAHSFLQPFAQIAIVVPPTVTYRHSNLAQFTLWTYRVRACNSAGCSAYSNTPNAFVQ